MPDAASPSVSATHSRAGLIVLAGIAAALFAARLSGPSDLLDNDQLRPAMYALDALRNGHWLCQRDPSGDITSKPPFYTWCIALLSAPFGGVNRFTLYLPCALAMLGAALVARAFGTALGGARAGLIAGLCVLCSSYGVKHVALARTDAVFGFGVALTAWCAWRGWRRGRGWVWFWLAAAGATLTKGPLGLVLGAMGLLAALRPRGAEGGHECRRGAPWWAGAPIYLLLCGGWFLAAWLQAGQPLIDKMIGRELLGHAVEGPGGAIPGAEFYKPVLYYLSRFLPWSPWTMIAVWRVWRAPSAPPEARSAERFLVWWLVGGLVVFSVASHQRADLLLPLVPAGAALGGIEIARLIRGWSRRRVLAVAAAMVSATLLGTVLWYHVVRAKDSTITDTRSVERLVERLRAGPLKGAEVVDIDAPFALQYFLGTAAQRTPPAVALDRMSAGSDALLATRDPAELAGAARDRGILLLTLEEAEGAKGTIVALMGLPRSERTPAPR